MKYYCNRFPKYSPWGGGAKFVNAFHKFVPEQGHEIVPADSMTIVPDAILLAGLNNDGEGISIEQAIMYKLSATDVKLILRVNENDARKSTSGMDDYLRKLAPHVDATVFVSQWLSDYFKTKPGWKCKNNTVIINGVDGDIFKSQPKLNNGKINIVTAHWSDNQNKGFDIYEKLDEFVATEEGKNFTFTYIGRDRRTFKNTNVIKPLSGKKLGEELGKYDVYISGSRWDPGPNHILEPLSAGLPTLVHKDGGGCVEFAGKDSVYSSWDELKEMLLKKRLPNQPQGIKLTDWSTCIKQYVDFIEKTCQLKTKT